MKHNRKKSGFTLVELMVFFVFISLVLAASAPIITKRVKYIPERVGHGKFMCYNNGHTQVYYNATQLISTQSVDQCRFTPPKKNTLYKVELIGAGAGGVNSSPSYSDGTDTRSGGYSLPGGAYGDMSIRPTGAQLFAIFKDVPFTLSHFTGSAGSGDPVSISYVGVGSPSISINTDLCFTSESYWADWCEYEVTVCDEDTDGNCIYDCTPKLDSDGNPILDADGNPEETCVQRTHKETRYGCTKMTENGDWDRDGVVEGPTKPYCSDWRSDATKMEHDISALQSCGDSTDQWCRTIATPEFKAPWESAAQANWDGYISSFSRNGSPDTGSPASGGKGFSFYLDGKINFCDYKKHPSGCGGTCTGTARGEKCVQMDEVDAYLQALIGSSYVAGSTKLPGENCVGWGYHEINEHDGTTVPSDTRNKDIDATNTDTHKVGHWGYDVLYYGAFKAWDKCATNTGQLPTGGEGGWITNNGASVSGSYSPGPTQGKDADDEALAGKTVGPEGAYSVAIGHRSQSIPSMSISTTLSTRTHSNVGNGGGAASYRIYYVSNLDKDCSFYIPSGGATISPTANSGTIAALEAGLTTSMTCNEGTLRLTAEGGRYNPGTFGHTYNGFDYVDLSSGIAQSPPDYTTKAGGAGSPFQPNDIYTKYSIPDGGFGAGGAGAYIVDGCTMITGDYDHTLVSSSGSAHEHYTVTSTKTSCNPEVDVQTFNATSGTGGAVIISW